MKKLLQQTLKQILIDIGITDIDPQVEIPVDLTHGDYTTNVAMVLAKRLKRSPLEIAKEIVKKIKDQKSKIKADKSYHSSDEGGQKQSSAGIDFRVLQDIENVTAAPPGFINFYLALPTLNTYMERVLNQTQISQPKAGRPRAEKIPAQGWSASGRKNQNIQNILRTANSELRTKKIMVEFAHPNTHKSFHIGHMRNIATGESIVRLLEAVGYKVIRANYQGDVGMHIAKAIYALLQIISGSDLKGVKGLTLKQKIEFLGKAYAAGSKAFEENEKAKETIKDYNFLVYAAAQRFQKERGIEPSLTDYLQFVKGKQNEIEEIYELWKTTRQWSLDYFETIYKRLGSRYDRYYFESECLSGVDLAREAVKKGVLAESDGAIIFNGKPYGLDTRVFVNSLGLPTYEAKELALAQKEFSEFGTLDQIIHVVGPEQASFFQVTFKTEELLGIQKDQQKHLVYGWVKLKHGKMSSRSGNVVLGEWLIDQAKKEICKILQKTSVVSRQTLDENPTEPPLSENGGQKLGSDLKGAKGLTLNGQTNYSEATKEEIAEKAAVAAVKYSFLKVSTRQEISFDLKESVNFNGDSGPYIQYTYARCKSVMRKAEGLGSDLEGVKGLTLKHDFAGGSVEARQAGNDILVLNHEEKLILRKLYQFPEVVSEAAANYAPNMICEYTYDLASLYNTFYNKFTILPASSGQRLASSEKDKKTSDFRLSLTAATAEILKQGLYLLGIETLERM